MRSVPWAWLADNPPPTAWVEIPTSGENLETAAPQGAGDVEGGAGIEQQGHEDRLFGLARYELAREG